jgi:tetratricopeptide (TPR) repeat protein
MARHHSVTARAILISGMLAGSGLLLLGAAIGGADGTAGPGGQPKASAPAEAQDFHSLIETLLAVGKEGAGAPQAAQALRQHLGDDVRRLPELLEAMDRASPEAANWLRAAVETLADRAVSRGQTLPLQQLEAFVLDRKHVPQARRLAYELLCRGDAAAPERLLPGMLDDPSPELRRDAVERVLRQGEAAAGAGRSDEARELFQKALAAARDRDQVDALVKHLKPLGVEVDLAGHFGFLRDWWLLGPFDNSQGVGFAASYPPERERNLSAEYPGKNQRPLRWKAHSTTDPYGMVDLNKALGKNMGAVAYAWTVVETPEARPVEIRVGSNNAVKVWLNGQLLIEHEEYHHGLRMDQYVGRGTLRPGRNEILVKVCQNERTEEWAQSWSFQLRLCDAVGTAVPVRVVSLQRPDGQEGGQR